MKTYRLYFLATSNSRGVMRRPLWVKNNSMFVAASRFYMDFSLLKSSVIFEAITEES